MRATATIPPFDLTKPLDQNIGSELKDSYGDEFWQMHSRLGTGHFLWISFLAIDVTSHLEREVGRGARRNRRALDTACTLG